MWHNKITIFLKYGKVAFRNSLISKKKFSKGQLLNVVKLACGMPTSGIVIEPMLWLVDI